jgi:hypothetical protein
MIRGRGLATSKVPIAEPPMINSSAGCTSTGIFPFSIRKPPITAPNTITMPMIENIFCQLIGRTGVELQPTERYCGRIS